MYSLRKSRKVLRSVFNLYKRKKKRLSENQKKEFETHLLSLQTAIKDKDRQLADSEARTAQKLVHTYLPKSFTDKTVDLILALAFALAVAIVVRQMWFEFYVIPTGSMRPTLKEQDYLVVSKDTFSLNTPLRTSHFYFNEDLVKRGGIIVFSGENMDIRDVDTVYFYIIPGKKQYVKRLIGKPGDILYFYGGKIYGIDKNGQEIKDFATPWFDKIEHIPFIHFEGKVQTPNVPNQGVFSPAIINQMGKPVAKMYLSSFGNATGEMLPQARGTKTIAAPRTYGDLWGIKNFAMARLLTFEQASELDTPPTDRFPLYLEITHHPSLDPVKLSRDEYNRLRPSISLQTSLIGLTDDQINTLFKSLYTARFIVKDGYVYRYGTSTKNMKINDFVPRLPDVPNGTYEFQDGIAYAIRFAGTPQRLPSNHPLYNHSPDRVQLLYNLGIEFDNHFAPLIKNQPYKPSRYAYFYNGDLYLMGHPVLLKNDPNLKQFVTTEKTFVDNGPPDIDTIRKYGLAIPDHMYLVLGDNHAMSADSRVFGFVPEANLRGNASFLFWPLSSRWGTLPEPSFPWFTLQRSFIWIIFLIIVIGYAIYHHKRYRKPLKF